MALPNAISGPYFAFRERWRYITHLAPAIVFLYFVKDSIPASGKYFFGTVDPKSQFHIARKRFVFCFGILLTMAGVYCGCALPKSWLLIGGLSGLGAIVLVGLAIVVLAAVCKVWQVTSGWEKDVLPPELLAGFKWSTRFLVGFAPLALWRAVSPYAAVIFLGLTVIALLWQWIFHTDWYQTKYVKGDYYPNMFKIYRDRSRR